MPIKHVLRSEAVIDTSVMLASKPYLALPPLFTGKNTAFCKRDFFSGIAPKSTTNKAVFFSGNRGQNKETRGIKGRRNRKEEKENRERRWRKNNP